MQIEIEKLTEAGQPFAHTYAPTALSLEDERARLLSEARVAGHISRKRQRVHVTGTVAAELEVYCDRCLTPVAIPVEAAFDLSYDPPDADDASEITELQAEDLVTSIYVGHSIDLDELTREQLLLALPTRSLCLETCKGLCPTCGLNLNQQSCVCEQKEIDPRWAGLAALKESSDE
jgi:uncharacterized protein